MNPDSKLDAALDMFNVGQVDSLTDHEGNVIGVAYYVCNDDGIIAYFLDEADANRFRLAEINRYLNG